MKAYKDDVKSAVLLMRVDPKKDPSEPMAELYGLAKSAGYNVLAQMVQKRRRDSHFQMGHGKIIEAAALGPDVLIFYNPLSPKQFYNISKDVPMRVLDRHNLILEVFARRASSREARLQVELARLTYEAPFVKSMISLRKETERPGFHGGGTYEESMVQDFKGRMAKIRKELANVEKTGESRREHRRRLGFELLALAGYTNAGKSTLLNRLTKAAVTVEDQLFTTLSPTTKAVQLGSHKALLTDTVGFIDDLPHFMIKSFRSTLAEIAYADLVLLVVDISDSLDTIRRKLAASHRALWDCGCQAPIITVLNKADYIVDVNEKHKEESNEFGPIHDLDVLDKAAKIADLAPDPVLVSAKDGFGIDRLLDLIDRRLTPLKEIDVVLPNDARGQQALSFIGKDAKLVEVNYGQEVNVRIRGQKEVLDRILKGNVELKLES